MPVYKEEATVCVIIEAVLKSLQSIMDLISDYEIIIVEDGSQDNTLQVLKDYTKDKEKIQVFAQPFNMGKGAAITKGFELSTGDFVLIQDADLEYDPNEYRVLLQPIISKGADVVYGSRFKGGDITRVLYFWHSLGNQFLTFLSNCFTNLTLSDMETCYKVFKGPLIRNMILTSKRFGIEPEMTAKISKVKGLSIYEVPISYYGRTYEEGKKIGWKDGVSALWCILKFNLFTSYEDSYKLNQKEILKLIKDLK